MCPSDPCKCPFGHQKWPYSQPKCSPSALVICPNYPLVSLSNPPCPSDQSNCPFAQSGSLWFPPNATSWTNAPQLPPSTRTVPLVSPDELRPMQINTPLVSWIMVYLTGRPPVRLRNSVSVSVLCNTGALQRTVFTLFLFTLHWRQWQCHLQKFSDDCVVVGWLSGLQEEEEYSSLVDDFVGWCRLNYLQLSISKTKEVIVVSCRTKPSLTHVSIQEEDVKVVHSYKNRLQHQQQDAADVLESGVASTSFYGVFFMCAIWGWRVHQYHQCIVCISRVFRTSSVFVR